MSFKYWIEISREKGILYTKAQNHDGEKLQGVVSGSGIDLWGKRVHTTKYKVREADTCAPC